MCIAFHDEIEAILPQLLQCEQGVWDVVWIGVDDHVLQMLSLQFEKQIQKVEVIQVWAIDIHDWTYRNIDYLNWFQLNFGLCLRRLCTHAQALSHCRQYFLQIGQLLQQIILSLLQFVPILFCLYLQTIYEIFFIRLAFEDDFELQISVT